MAELRYFTGPMDCGKSTLALQLDHSYRGNGRRGQLFTNHDRAGAATISSRLGPSRPAVEVGPGFDFEAYVRAETAQGRRLDYLICDETQFYGRAQIDQLARLVDQAGVEVLAFGILTDFQTGLFPGSQRLVELADRIETLPVTKLCWCGRPGTHNARTVGGRMVSEGDQVLVGNTVDAGDDPSAYAYEVLCRRHHRAQQTRLVADHAS